MNDSGMIMVGICLILLPIVFIFLIWFLYNEFIRRECPVCESKDFSKLRAIKTYVAHPSKEYTIGYSCNKCGHEIITNHGV